MSTYFFITYTKFGVSIFFKEINICIQQGCIKLIEWQFIQKNSIFVLQS